MENIFIEKAKNPKPGLNVGILMGKSATKGEVGLEIEVEGKNLPHEGYTPPPWTYHHDGSLRGQENAEYVLYKPLPFDKVPEALDTLWAAFAEKKSKFDDSNRTSVHVHLNCQGFHLNRLASFFGLYFTVEEILTNFCGEYRVGNLFCLRAIDAPAIVLWAKRFIKSDGQTGIPDILHYSAMNMHSLKKFGSIEIRTLRGTSDKEVIKTWVAILERLYKVSADFPDPTDICTMVSSNGGAIEFFDSILGNLADVVRKGCGMSNDEIRDSIYVGIRFAQDICYCRDWALYKPIPLKPDPFSRNLKGVAKKVLGPQGQAIADQITSSYTVMGGLTTEPPVAGENSGEYWVGDVQQSEEQPESYDDEEHYPEEPDF